VNVIFSRRATAVAAIAGASAFALAAAGCSSGGNTGNTSSGEGITLSVTTFGTMGFEELYEQYESENPNITIEANNIDTGGNARTDTFTKLAAGSGLSDVVAIEEGWLGSIMEVSDQFTDLSDFDMNERQGDWLDWKVQQVTDPEGRIIGYGTDVGPTGLCYNAPAFEAAGLPTEREEVAELFGGENATWESYFELGREYQETTGKAWYDHNGFLWNAMVNQLEEGYYTADGELKVEDNAELRERFGWIAQASDAKLSAASTAWDWNGGKAFTDQTFATFVCPGWMLGVVQGQLEAGGGGPDTGWDFADVFPGGAANWGGSWLSVPSSSEHPEEAAALASWLTQPEQQLAAFEAAGAFPSTVEAQEELAANPTPNPVFNDAPIGEILVDRSQGVVAQFKGPDDSLIQENVFGPPLQKLERGEASEDEAWQEAIMLLNDLVG
jgi:cellobiose transport system substrate-binding protein